MLSKTLAAVAAISMITGSSAAVAQSSAPTSVAATARAGAPTQGSNELVGTTAWIIAAVALGLIVWGIIELTDDDAESP